MKKMFIKDPPEAWEKLSNDEEYSQINTVYTCIYHTYMFNVLFNILVIL